MRHRKPLPRLLSLLILVMFAALPVGFAAAQDATPTSGVTVIASGLTNPRGFTWGGDGTIYLALAGTGGTEPVVVEATPQPFFPGQTASIVSVADGCPSTIADGLPSVLLAEPGWVFGATDVQILDGQLYALTSGSGDPKMPNGVYWVGADGTLKSVADLAAWSQANPPKLKAPDYDPNGNFFDMEAGTDRLWITEAVGGRLLTVMQDGKIALVADLSDNHMVPSGLALDGQGGAYVAFETTPPYTDGSSKVVHVAADGTVTDAWTGLTALTDIAMGPDGNLYAAEMSTNNSTSAPFLQPNSGKIVRQTGPDSLEEVVTDVPYPAFIGFDAAGALVLDYPGFGTTENRGEGIGALVSVDISTGTPVSLAGMEMPAPTCLTGATPFTPVATP
jgi:hypothetical protein